MAVLKVVLLFAVILMSGCYDKFYGPKLRNEYLSDIEIEVFYNDGRITKSVLPSCRSVFLGVEDSFVERVLVRHNNVVDHDLVRQDILEIMKEEGMVDGRLVIVVSKGSMSLSKDQECSILK